MSSMNYRLYAFVANHYLSPLQCGLQTAHVVAEMSLIGSKMFRDWAKSDKTIIICGAGNHRGVLDCWDELKRTGIDPGFVTGAIFHEDEQSMNGMATACGVIVPEKYWNVEKREGEPAFDGTSWHPETWVHVTEDSDELEFPITHAEGQFISHIKKYRLA